MGSRERKRAQRRKRKRRSSERSAEAGTGGPEGAGERADSGEAAEGADAEPEALDPMLVRRESGQGNGSIGGTSTTATESRSERRNREAREALEPLHEGERPTVVTVAAVISTAVVVLSILGYALWDVLRPDEPRPEAGGVVIFVAIVGPMAWGLWRARYWAVLGFQTVLLFVVVISAVGLVSSLSVLLAVGNLVLVAASGTLFYFMIKAWARIQMPTRLPRE